MSRKTHLYGSAEFEQIFAGSMGKLRGTEITQIFMDEWAGIEFSATRPVPLMPEVAQVGDPAPDPDEPDHDNPLCGTY